MRFRLVWLAMLVAGIAQAQEMEFQVELMNRVGTETNRKGDLVSARVVAPSGFQGSIFEGKVTESKSGAKSGGESVLDIDFDIMRHNNTVIPVNSRIKSVGNSKGQVNVDEDGRVLGRATSSNKRSSGTGGLGRAIGGITGGRAARIGSAVDTAATVLFRVSADAPNLRFDPGSKFTLTASARSGPALADLASSAPATAAAPAASAPATTPQSASGSAQPNFTALKDEFMPGENTVFYDDFTDMSAGDAPPHFKVRGSSPELTASGSIRQLNINQKGVLTPNLNALPKNFTFEALVKVEPNGRSGFTLMLLSRGKQILHWAFTGQQKQVDLIVSMRAPYAELGRKRVVANLDQPIKLAFWVQNGRMRSYVNGEKALDFNQVDLPPMDGVEFDNGVLGAGAAFGFRMVRFAESTPDFSQVIASSGRYIARGILFDTDSDAIKPESAPVIRQIAKGLETNPNLKLLIEGHTDSVGDAAHNMDLSKRRAEAVRSVLISQFNVDAARLTAAGLGSTKPVDTNDTPQGRAQNRRVELVKQ